VNDQILEREQRIELSLEETFDLFADAFNLERITPPWLNFHVITPRPIEMREGTLLDYKLRLHAIPVTWRTRITEWSPPHRFVDEQLSGPYALWHHTHTFEPDGDATVIRDRVRYRIGFGPLGSLALALFVRRDVERIFDYRREAMLELITSRAPST
jgi:ligand-binding SRPBCC domain-containing protein